jgi:transcriptional regulator with XRE-family HTH domain
MPSKKSAANQKLDKTIRATREKNGQTQEKAARCAGVDGSYFGSIERGEFNISLDTIVKIQAGLDTKPSALCARARILEPLSGPRVKQTAKANSAAPLRSKSPRTATNTRE